jgi:sugar lactone lactonase YvrE
MEWMGGTMSYARLARPLFAVALVLGVVGTRAVAAQEGTPVALPPLPANCTVVADGLLSPRFVAVADDGTVYVTEAGTGGDEVLGAPPTGESETATPVAEALPSSTRGFTGQVTKIDPDGTQTVLATGFASYSDGVGPAGIAIGPDGQIYIAVGGAGVGAGIEPLEGENTIYRIDPDTGEATVVANLGQFEVDNNPDNTDVNPNLYGIAFGADAQLYVNDAGGNTIYQVDPEAGTFTLEAVVPGVTVAGDTGFGTPVAEAIRQPVPTGIALGDDGTLLIALLSEDWPAEAPSIFRLEDDGTLTPVAFGLSAVVGLAVGPDGKTYASQLTTDFANFGPGNVISVDELNNVDVAVDGLVMPHGIAFDAAGNLFVPIFSVSSGPGGPPGQLLRCEGVAGTGA